MIANEAIPLSLYIHVPWCVRKCPYCDFNSHQAAEDGIPEADYIAALIKDLEQLLPLVWGRRISTIFFGGGTPSLLTPQAVAKILSAVRARIQCFPGQEVTLEANPGSIEMDKFQDFRDAGISRISLGVQSFADKNLQVLGRIHDSDQAHRAVQSVIECQFDSYNIDLMFGLPGQDMLGAQHDLNSALSYQPPHLSLYQLTIEANTLFAHLPPQDLPGNDLLADMQDELVTEAAVAGLERYEVSAYAESGNQCRHNINYWKFGDYVGIGAGAHSKISSQTGVIRFSRPRLPRHYMATAGKLEAFVGKRKLEQADLVLEYMINVLRLRKGFTLKQFSLYTGLQPGILSGGIEEAKKKGLLMQDCDNIHATDKGFAFLSEIQLLFT